MANIFTDIGNFAGKAAGFFAHPLERGFEKTRTAKARNTMNEQLAILKGDFSDDEKETAARTIIQAVQPKYYEAEIARDPNRRFYDPILTREQEAQKRLNPYGRRTSATTDPLVQGAVDIGKIQTARSKFEDDITPETAAYFDAAEKSVKARTGFKEPEINPKTGKPRRIFSKEGQVVGTRTKEGGIDNRDYFSSEDLLHRGPIQQPQNIPPAKTGERIKPTPLEDYFQAPTETVPEANIPRTFEQIGIGTTEDQATFQEMQKALPDRDLRQEYENDPEGMERLMELWRKGKLNKQNIGKAFSMLQQKARQSLGILS